MIIRICTKIFGLKESERKHFGSCSNLSENVWNASLNGKNLKLFWFFEFKQIFLCLPETEREYFDCQNMRKNFMIGRSWADVFWLSEFARKSFYGRNLSKNILFIKFWALMFACENCSKKNLIVRIRATNILLIWLWPNIYWFAKKFWQTEFEPKYFGCSNLSGYFLSTESVAD